MELKKSEKSEGKLVFQVEIDSAAFEAAVNKAYLQAKKNINVPGFRKGKAPRMIIENMYGAGVFYDDAVNALAQDAYTYGLEQSGERVVGRPSMTNYNVDDAKALTIDYSVALYPEVTLGEYKGIEAYKETVDVTDTEVDAEVEKIRKRNARIQTVERPAQTGDTVNIDYDGYKDGVRFDGGKDEKHDLVLGSNSFVPGFEEQLIGVSAGDEKDIDITFPEDYDKSLAGAAVVFKIKVNEVKESILPELDDEFAKDVSEFDTLAEYKADVKKNLTETKENSAAADFHRAVLEKAAANMTCSIPAEMVEEQVDNMMRDYEQNVTAQGMRFDQYLQMMGMDENTFRSIMRPAAEQQTRNEVLLEAVAGAEGIEISDDDLEAEYKRLAEQYGVELEQVKMYIPAETVRTDLKRQKAADIVYGAAVATDKKEDESAEPEKSADAE